MGLPECQKFKKEQEQWPSLNAKKYDTGKPPVELLSTHWLFSVAEVLAFGAKKYSKHNWRSGLPDSQARHVAAALRHLLAYNEGEDLDPESGLSHLHHASCAIMFASELAKTHPELDGRFKHERK